MSITETFPAGLNWYGARVRTLWVNTNGIVSLAGPFSAEFSNTPTAFPAMGRPMIAPFWADVDTLGGGQPARNSVWWTVRPDLIAVTWHDVERHVAEGAARDGRSNDFQLLMERVRHCATMDWRIEFRFHRIEWTASDRAPDAIVGFDGGDLRNFVSLPMSRSPAIADVARNTNVPDGAPGLYRFATNTFVDVAVCGGFGARCRVPDAQGLCAQGVVACRGYTEAYCRPVIPRRPRCNGLDNDCDGRPDDADALCPPGARCDTQRGACVAACARDSDCAPDDRCAAGRCVARVCQDVQCPPGEVCRAGGCASPCAGVRCPYGQRCDQGACVDGCEGVQCVGSLCIAGQCSYGCGCAPCPDGGVCGDEGFCIAPSCAGVRCASRTHCDEGRCVSDCVRALAPGERVCPLGEVCEGGVCVLELGAPSDAGAAVDAVAARDAPSDVARDGATGRALVQSGCGCRASASRERWSVCGLALAWLLARRRRASL